MRDWFEAWLEDLRPLFNKALKWMITAKALMLIATIASSYAAYQSYKVSENTSALSIRQANDYVVLQRPSIALLGGVITKVHSDEQRKEFHYLLEVKLKNSGARSAIDFGLSIEIPVQVFGLKATFPRTDIPKETELTFTKKFITRETLAIRDRDEGYVAWAYLDKFPVYKALSEFGPVNDGLAHASSCGELKLRKLSISNSESDSRWVVVFEDYLPLVKDNNSSTGRILPIVEASIGDQTETQKVCTSLINSQALNSELIGKRQWGHRKDSGTVGSGLSIK